MTVPFRSIDRRIREALRDNGFEFLRRSGGGHYVFRHLVTRRHLAISCTPRADGIQKVLGDIRRIVETHQ